MSKEEYATRTLEPDDWAWAFFASYTGDEDPWNATAAARAAGIDRTTARDRRKYDPVFAGLWDEADLHVRDMLLAPLIKDAINGIERGVYRKGERIDTEHVPDNKLRMWLLERIDPDTFHLNTRIEAVTNNGLPSEFKFQMGETPRQIEGRVLEETDETA